MSQPVSLSDLKSRRAIPACSHCGSGDVRAEAFVAWSDRLNEWKITDILDGNTVCGACGRHCEIKWRIAA